MQQDNQEFIEIGEAAKKLKVTRKTFERHALARGMQRYKRGLRNQVFYTKEDVDALYEWLYRIRPDTEEPK